MKIIYQNKRLLVCAWAVRAAFFAVALILSAGLLHRLFGMGTPVALNLFVLAFAFALIAIALALFGLYRIWQRGYRGTTSALIAATLGLLILSWPMSIWQFSRKLPQINDVTTDTERPPTFDALASNRPPGAKSTDYPGEEFARLQLASYGDLQSLELDRDADEVTELVSQALRKLRMRIVRETSPESNRGIGTVEAVDRTLILGFYDDVIVRVLNLGRDGSLVDVRSASRYGRHDFGRNAERVRQILKTLVERLQATVPEKRARRRRGRRAANRLDRSRPVTRPRARRRTSSDRRSRRAPSQ